MKISNLFLIAVTLFISSNLSAQTLSTFQGFWGPQYYQDQTKISKQAMEAIIAQDSEAHQLWQKSKRNVGISWVALGAEIGFLVWQLNRGNNNDSQVVPFVGVLASAGVTIGFSISAARLKKEAILKYNANADVGSIILGPTYNGIGAVVRF